MRIERIAFIAILALLMVCLFTRLQVDCQPEPIEITIEAVEPADNEQVLLFEATAYYEGDITSTGTKPIAYRTASVDKNVIPYGTEFTIDAFPDIVWIADDCGNSWSDERSHTGYYKHIRGNRLDLRLPTRKDCMNFGRQEVKVIIIGD